MDPLRIDLKGDLHETVALAVPSVAEQRVGVDTGPPGRGPKRELIRLVAVVVVVVGVDVSVDVGRRVGDVAVAPEVGGLQALRVRHSIVDRHL